MGGSVWGELSLMSLLPSYKAASELRYVCVSLQDDLYDDSVSHHACSLITLASR